MGWAIAYDDKWERDIGYGVVALCDHPDCNKEIDRGLSYVCSHQEPRGGDGCGLYFCGDHQSYVGECERCQKGMDPFPAKPEHPFWIRFKLLDPSWNTWREECPDEAKEFEDMWAKLSPDVQAVAEARTKKEMEWQAEGDTN